MWLLACSADAPVAEAVDEADERPNILLLTLDTTRADHLQSYGYFRQTTPALDLLAEQSVFFEQAWSPMSTTLPTHWSILTGAWPFEHGVLGNLGNREPGEPPWRPNEGMPSLAAHLADQGYQTAGFVSAIPLAEHTGIAQGFADWKNPKAEVYQVPAQLTVTRALDWLEARDRDRPFFLWVHLFDPHYPWNPAPGYAAMYGTDEGLNAWMEPRQFTQTLRGVEVDETFDAHAMANAYDAELRYMDAHIARLLGTLEGRALLDRTAIAVVGDHGEALGQHNELQHGNVWREQLQVPMMLKVPGVEPTRVAHPVSAVQALPTLMALLEMEWSTSAGSALEPGPVFAQRTGDHRPDLGPPSVVWVDGPWTLVHDGSDRLYNLDDDPFQLVDVSAEHPERTADMRAAVLKARDEQQARYVPGEATGQLDPAMRAGLEALGYVEGE